MNQGFWAMWFIGAICLTVSIPGGYFAQSRTLTEVFGRLYAGVFGTTLFVCSFLVLIFAIQVLSAIEESIKKFSNPIAIGARDRLRSTIFRLFPSLLLIGATNILAAVFPPLLAVYLPLNGALGCLNGIIRVRRELLPDSELFGNSTELSASTTTDMRSSKNNSIA